MRRIRKTCLSIVSLCFIVIFFSVIVSVTKVYATGPGSENFEASVVNDALPSPQVVGNWTFSVLNASGQNDSSAGIPIDSNYMIGNTSKVISFLGVYGDDYSAQIKSNAGAFKLNSFKVANINSNTDDYKVVGYLSGSPVSGATQTFSYSWYSPGTVTLSGAAWGNIDEFRIVKPDGTADIGVVMDDINVSNPVTPPTVTGISPSSGPTTGGTTVTITGTGFTGATAVKFGSTDAAYTVNSDTQITATAPAGSPGVADITVVTSGGTSATGSADQFTYSIPAPTVTGITPSLGSIAGGTTVTITGVNFSGATAVKFGIANATYNVDSDTQITATAPAGSAGVADITVVTAGGTSATSSADQFTYMETVAAPTASIAGGAVASGTTVTLSSGTDGATIYYTTDGSAPTASSTQYTGAITVTSGMTIKAIAVKSGMTDSSVMSESYTIMETVAAPTASIAGGAVASGTTVTLSSGTDGATIYYTTDGSTPTASSTQYTGAITVTSGMTIKAIAVKSGMTDSSVMSESYTIISTYTVTFKDYNGTVLKTQSVNEGGSATAPTAPTRVGYAFAGWDKIFTNITENITVMATYTPTVVILTSDSLGAAGNSKVTGLTTGTKYKVTVGGTTKYVKADATLSDSESDVGALSGTEITGLTNGTTYNVQEYTPAPIAPSITTQPVSETKTEGDTASFSVTATGDAPLSYQWEKDGANLAGKTSATLTLNNVQKSDEGNYTVVVTNSAGSITSDEAILTVTTPAAVTYTLNYTAEAGGTIEGNSSQTVNEGDNGSEVTAVANLGYHFVGWSDGNSNASRKDTNITEDIDVSAEFELALPSSTNTTPAGVTIIGTKQVDNTLEAQLIDENGSNVTTSAAVTYKWYRMSNNDSKNGTLVGEGETYKLVSADIGKYIKLIVSYINETFEKTTSKIFGNSSSSSAGSSSHSSSSSSSAASSTSSTEQITVKVTDGSSDNSISQTVIERTTASDGTKTDTVTYTADKAQETIAALASEGKDTARIVATDTDANLSETQVNIPKETLSALSSGNVNLQIETGGAIVSLPKESVQGLVQSGQLNGDLYFRLVPIKDETKQTEIKTTADQQATIKAVSGNSGVQVLGTPMTIETNMSQRAVDIVLPLKGIAIPTDATERQAFLNDLGVFIEHSDGEKVLEKGQVVEYAAGVFGIKFTVNKFSDFTIVKLNQKIQTGWKQINGYWYFFNNTGAMTTGWYKSESGDWTYNGKDTVGQWFHLGTDGKMDIGWFKDTDGSWYFLCDGKDYGALGYMETGWKFTDGKWYFLKGNGAMATGWTYVDGNWYYLYSDGSMASNTVIDGYTLGTDGAWIQ
ncbi:chitobiase/beta-hexosaminidase C-terminal domain-containing protein [Clostridium sp.]|uniref:chitobiase/beta-hexosaminidase C-terminal domain-containing protein n=1 Tax=Clostridium sp. TaxID=1506 RepID=UPI00263486C9|nr:chitobiase/beta-hexosaminidase C-terminal domain-containing protein [Clostridium sp.]